jgi:hypothetical protein
MALVPAPEEVRLYEVTDLLSHLECVPKKGCCVMPLPATSVVDLPLGWSMPGVAVEGGAQVPEPAPDPALAARRDAARRRSLELRVAAATEEAKLRGLRSVVDSARGRSAITEEPADALIQHVRSRISGAEGADSPCLLAVRGGTTLEARGPPAVLEIVERALAELR